MVTAAAATRPVATGKATGKATGMRRCPGFGCFCHIPEPQFTYCAITSITSSAVSVGEAGGTEGSKT
jgi:hypothetical protein